MIKPSFKPACLVLFTRLGRRAAQEGGGLAGNRTVASSIPGSSQLGVGVSLSETPHPDGSWRAGCRPAGSGCERVNAL